MSSEQSPAPAGPGPGRPGRELTVRRAPKFGPFLAAGTVLGVLAAVVVALTGPESAEFTRGSIFGFFAVVFGVAGLLLGGIVALVLDRMSVKRAGHLLAEETVDQPGTPEQADGTEPPERGSAG
ncbi:hypothetical protein ACFQ36_19440 [Arthrobacter sp. GCM10027362]|uniref:hypothetical protein n=1 Tax=Arthrobacter sp. GCM10027362 TaxID=3273379 RepID=UPI00364451E8